MLIVFSQQKDFAARQNRQVGAFREIEVAVLAILVISRLMSCNNTDECKCSNVSAELLLPRNMDISVSWNVEFGQWRFNLGWDNVVSGKAGPKLKRNICCRADTQTWGSTVGHNCGGTGKAGTRAEGETEKRGISSKIFTVSQRLLVLYWSFQVDLWTTSNMFILKSSDMYSHIGCQLF